jgi:dolichyl-phosphate beta-glucosyltransferase
VIVPAFREERRIAATVVALRSTLGAGTELIVVDDGSPDRTSEAAREAGADGVIRLPVNRGKGAAVRAGMLAASGSTVAFTDADLSYSPDQLLRLRDEVEAGWDVVVGNRHHAEARTLVRSGRLRELTGRVFQLMTRVVLARRYGDTQCGLKGFHRAAATRIFGVARVDGFAFDVEVLWLAAHFGFAVTEVPVELASAEGSTVRLNVDPVRMVRDLVRLRRWAASGVYDRGPSRLSPGPG